MTNNTASFARKAVKYFLTLNKVPPLPSLVSIMNPYTSAEVISVVNSFYNKFYSDKNNRIFIFGINPGRFGGGITGIPFTDPLALEDHCGICNDFVKKRELSSTFIYTMISRLGGAGIFFSKFYLSALFPLALIKRGKNLNYYDDQDLFARLKPYMLNALERQLQFGAGRTAISLGKRNTIYLSEFNVQLKYFDKIITLEHPRYIMQYKRKELDTYLNKYLSVLKS
jgi:hypothetical protein